MKKVHISRFEESYNYFIDNNPIYKQDIDIVYTWVNKDDPDWKKLWSDYFSEDILDTDRFAENDELKYSLRSIYKYAPWVRNIYVLTNCNPPDWLKEHEKIKWISHQDVIDKNSLPTFNSHAIETSLHKIKDLSKFFIYFNDDVLLSQPASRCNFLNEFGQTFSFFEEYSMVDPLVKNDNDFDYIKASKNSQSLLNTSYSSYLASRLHKHVPTVLNKETLEKIENEFHDAIINTRMAKLRSDSDINLTSFFYHHYSLYNSLSCFAKCNSLLVRPQNIQKIEGLRTIPYQFLCFNDGGKSSINVKYKNQVKNIFDSHFSLKAPWEK